ncbi:MAG TPA: SRPBCC domain-containing protein [Spirochaetia bacterium]|nr:SRPBCC domain-containing protein [Spirochaetia bacterium]
MSVDVETIIEDRKVTYRRYIDVPVSLAFEAWSTREHLSRWWGPDGFTLTTLSLDFSSGGTWEFVMHGPDGHNYRNRIRFLEIDRPRLIRYAHWGDGEGGPDVEFEASVLFEASGDGTRLTLVQLFPSPEELQRVQSKYRAIEGARQHMDSFARYVESAKGKGE